MRFALRVRGEQHWAERSISNWNTQFNTHPNLLPKEKKLAVFPLLGTLAEPTKRSWVVWNCVPYGWGIKGEGSYLFNRPISFGVKKTQYFSNFAILNGANQVWHLSHITPSERNTSRTGEAKLNLVKLRAVWLKKIAFELCEKLQFWERVWAI